MKNTTPPFTIREDEVKQLQQDFINFYYEKFNRWMKYFGLTDYAQEIEIFDDVFEDMYGKKRMELWKIKA